MKIAFSFSLMCFSFLALSQYQFPAEGTVFTDEEVPRIDITIDEDDLAEILNPQNLESNTEFPARFIFSSTGILDTLENIGFRLRGNTSRSAGKKSFKVSFNSFEGGRKFYGLEKLNLNGEHNDPSICRSKLAWDLFRYAEVPSSRSNHVELYINDEYKGLYINVEHIDEEFIQKRMSNKYGNLWKCLWPADMLYRGVNPDLYAEPEPWGRRAYDLRTNTDRFDYSDLAHLIDVLNNYQGSEFECELERIFDVDNYLRAIAIDVLIGNWDGPIVNKNNFYLYHNPATDRFTYVPYDLDNTFGIDWFSVNWATSDIYDWSKYSGESRPIYDRLMQVPEWRARYSYYLNDFLEQFFSSSMMNSYLDDKLELLTPFRIDDSYASLDYGYSHEDFLASYEMGLENHIEIGFKPYINIRINSANSQLELVDFPPAVRDLNIAWSEDSLIFNLKYYDDSAVESIIFHYSVNGEAWESTDIPVLNSAELQYTFMVDQLGPMQYYFELMDATGVSSSYPLCEDGMLHLGFDETPELVINELMASNFSKVQDEYGEYDDWIELFNRGGQPIDLGELYLSDDPDLPTKWKLPNAFLYPSEYFVIWADNDNEQGTNHSNFKLSKDGEFLGLYDGSDNNHAPIDTLTFPALEQDQSYARLPNGTGDFQVAPYMTHGYNNELPSSLKKTNEIPILVYPNPVSEILIVSHEQQIEFFQLYNLQGVLTLTSKQSKTSVSHIAAGCYMLKAYLKNGNVVTKSIVIF